MGIIKGNSMNKAELIALVSSDTKTTAPEATAAVNSVFKHIAGSLAKKETFQLIGFGTFSTGIRKARTGRNPSTGDPIDIPSSVSVKFKVGKALKDAVNE
jgi:DNA-binding protein HU-beta